jgi:phosphate-selective porin OprO/OprP
MKTLPLALAAAAVLATFPASAQDKPVAAPAEAPAPKPADGFLIQSETGDYKLQVRGYTHFDGRFFSGDESALAIDTFVLRRVRPIVSGTVAKYFEFNITPDFGGGATVLQDAFLNVKYTPKFQVKVGKFKSPVGLERLQSATAITFVERAFPTALVPNRDVGVQLHGDLAGGVFSYAAGVFDGAPDGGSVDLDLNDGKDLAGRVFLSPFKKGKGPLKELGFGISGTTGKQSGPLPAYRSNGQISLLTFLTGVTADGTRQRFSPQLSYYVGRFGLLAEYVKSESRLKKADASHVDFEASAWQTTVSLALTGDKASYSGVKPAKPFEPSKGQWGALELAARVNGIEIERSAFTGGLIDPLKSPREAFAWAVGLNWSLNRHVKQVFDYERTSFTGGAAAGADRDDENAIFIRTQISF